MKQLSILFLLLSAFVKLNAQQKPKALTAKVVYDAVYQAEKGMKIYPKIQGRRNDHADLLFNTCFYLENGKELNRFNNFYCCESGKIASAGYSSSQNSIGNEGLFIFIPYAKLNLSPKKVHKVKFALMAFEQDQSPKSSVYYHSIINML
ncbi:hypothetical protein EV200_104337 [Pedobacter psychrotolerans]|uniref:Uncharacterized protein n=1 Tax=Pedobacter psychrotolerans TaxID=1843235 RepID=A0A4R2HG84_9SPHI|nr:hypothetical protein [Pedobacter psychrotolerans]TCO25300.1 hypothetical protein EV200_104337 [Pedobacter psychrotolerans]GGE46621.1 hypothetical protein GCM10011413_10840 [Pedobacter psychrotolerans]